MKSRLFNAIELRVIHREPLSPHTQHRRLWSDVVNVQRLLLFGRFPDPMYRPLAFYELKRGNQVQSKRQPVFGSDRLLGKLVGAEKGSVRPARTRAPSTAVAANRLCQRGAANKKYVRTAAA